MRLVLHFPAFSDDICSALHGQCTDNGASVWKRFEASASWLFSAAVQRCLLPTAAASFCFFFLSPPIWLGPQVAPRDPTFCGGEWGELHTSHVNLDSVHSKVMCSSFKHIRVCVCVCYMKGFSLICLYPLLLLRHSYLHRLLNQQNSCNAILGISCWYQSVSISASDEHCYPSAMGKHSLHVPSAFSAAAASVCWSSQHPSSRLYSLTPGKMPLLAYLSHTPRHFQ